MNTQHTELTAHCAELERRLEQTEAAIVVRDKLVAVELEEKDREIERLAVQTSQLNEAMAVCYSVEEWMQGRISSEQLKATAESVFSRWGADD